MTDKYAAALRVLALAKEALEGCRQDEPVREALSAIAAFEDEVTK